MHGAAELASDVFGTGVRVGVPSENLSGLLDSVESPRFATAVGLALYGANRVALGTVVGLRRIPIGKGMEGIAAKVKFWLQDFF